MDPLIDSLADKGMVGVVAIGVLWLLRENIAAARKPVDRAGPADLQAALLANTAALGVMDANFKRNISQVDDLGKQVVGIGHTLDAINGTLERLLTEVVRGNGMGGRRG